MDGSWIAFRWDELAPNPFHALELWGFDKTAKQFTDFIHSNFGGVRLFKPDADWTTGDRLTCRH